MIKTLTNINLFILYALTINILNKTLFYPVMDYKILGKGAEAVIYIKGSDVVKDRIKKNYRIPEIDVPLRSSRTRREAKILNKLESIGFPAPRIIETDKKEKIIMSFVEGSKVRDILDGCYEKISVEIGKKLRILHDNGIIHGDLTTSNMILKDEVYFIDFGLSFFSDKAEDKAVDLHLLRQALESKHYRIWKKCFGLILKNYSDKTIIKRLEKVESRGRNKTKH